MQCKNLNLHTEKIVFHFNHSHNCWPYFNHSTIKITQDNMNRFKRVILNKEIRKRLPSVLNQSKPNDSASHLKEIVSTTDIANHMPTSTYELTLPVPNQQNSTAIVYTCTIEPINYQKTLNKFTCNS